MEFCNKKSLENFLKELEKTNKCLSEEEVCKIFKI